MTALALLFIRFYQRFISPHKGFRCAHAAFFGGTSCSGAIYNLILERGLWHALPQVRVQFQECSFAYHTLLRMGRITAGGVSGGQRKCKACDALEGLGESVACCDDISSCWPS